MHTDRRKFLFTTHAVFQVQKRRVPLDAIVQIARFGVTVQESGKRIMKRGELRGAPVHVVVEEPNIVETVYFADEWISTVTVERICQSEKKAMALS